MMMVDLDELQRHKTSYNLAHFILGRHHSRNVLLHCLFSVNSRLIQPRTMILTHFRLNNVHQPIYWKSSISILDTSHLVISIFLFVNSGDPDQTPHSAASDLGLHCLPITSLGISSLKSVKINI